MDDIIRRRAFDERSICTSLQTNQLIDLENVDSLSDILLAEKNGRMNQNKFTDTKNDAGVSSGPPFSQPIDVENNCNGDTAARLKTLQLRNQSLQRALALASVQYSKEISSMKRKIEKLEQQVADLKGERKEATK